MTKLSTLSTLIAAAGLSLSAAVILSTPAKAVGSMLEKCGPQTSRALVEKCCATWIQKKGRPFWMIEANVTSCGSVVSCTKKQPITYAAVAYKPKCQINILKKPDGGSNPNTPKSTPNTPTFVGKP